ncbi:SMI1/KNR4 family protein [Amycolatopsis sp. VS8301801F10]|uniref:SMI1/KNR4 family protein n=1 Tax=Amycolatopsis sp. VS8301801F10 TaxID=2652442 RepID=UPI0038FC3174
MDLGEIGRTLAERVRDAVGDRQSGATVQISWHDWGTRTAGWLDEEPPDDPYLHVNTFGVLTSDLPRGVYETRLRRDGSYRFSFSSDVDLLAERAGFVFDPDFRYPGHPLPGMQRPAGLEPTGTPTDPAALRQVGALVEEFAERHTAIMGRAPWWAPGASEEEISVAEAQIGVRLPEDLRALFRLVGRDIGESGLLGRYSHDSLETLVKEYCSDDLPGSCAGVPCDSPLEDIRPVFDADPPGRLKRVFRNDWWVIFGGDRSGEYLAVDLDPDVGGQSGQVFAYGSSEAPHLVGRSVAAMIEEVLKALRAGRYTLHEGDHRIEVHASFADLPVRHPIESVRDGAEALIGIDHPELVQACYLHHDGDLDLTVFEPLRSLRDIGARGAKTVTPTMTNLPLLESLTISAEQIDLKALAGHPTLWDLALHHLAHPVDLSPLATLPNLTRLDIAGLDVPAIDQLAHLPALRVLTLDASQLTRLLASGHRLPQLAALTISGRVLLAEAVEFLRQLRGNDVHLQEFTGSLTAPPGPEQA